jgi:hypothetical protein
MLVYTAQHLFSTYYVLYFAHLFLQAFFLSLLSPLAITNDNGPPEPTLLRPNIDLICSLLAAVPSAHFTCRTPLRDWFRC